MPTGLFDARPPFVRFEQREYGFDPEATQRSGRPIPRVVDMACITPHGSKDVVDKVAIEWLEQIKQKALRGEFPASWVDTFKMQYEEWKKGNELPRDGTPVKTWSAVNKEQQVRLLAMRYTTVEDLAMVPDGALGELGLDGRYLRDLARNWLAEGQEKGISAKKIAEAEMALDQLRLENTDLRAANADMRRRLEALENAEVKRGPGRPRKEEQAA